MQPGFVLSAIDLIPTQIEQIPHKVRHEDAENMTCWPPFSRQRNAPSGQSPGVLNVRLAADIMACLQNSNRRNDAPLSPSSFRPSRLAGLSSNLAYTTSVFIGYIGTDSIGSFTKRFAAKKAGVEDGRNQ